MEGNKVRKQTSAEQGEAYSSSEDRRQTYEERGKLAHIAEYMGRFQGKRVEVTEHTKRKHIGGFITKFEARRGSGAD